MFFVTKIHRENGKTFERRYGKAMKSSGAAKRLCVKVQGFIRDEHRNITGQSFNADLPLYVKG